MKSIFTWVLPLTSLFFLACDEPIQTFKVKNTLDINRSFETVEIPLSKLNLLSYINYENLEVKDILTDSILVSQLVDSDLDGTYDILLFQPSILASSEKEFELIKANGQKKNVISYCFSRFVPERTDDYAWENNKVAFRTFGPTAQKLAEDGVKGGTLTSGIDAWLKRVDYPIINRWYKKYLKDKNGYHRDDGEGLDNFHVGLSRGVGGIAVKKDTSYYTSKNFTNWKTITTGPIRTSFILEYDNWDADGSVISETKHISLDYGSHLSKFEVEISGADTIYSGLTLHEKDGESTHHIKSGWISYWQPHGESELGTGIVVPNSNMVSYEIFDSQVKDLSNFFAEIRTHNGIATYYSGFGWKEAMEFTSKDEWEKYLETFSKKLNNPLIVDFKVQ